MVAWDSVITHGCSTDHLTCCTAFYQDRLHRLVASRTVLVPVTDYSFACLDWPTFEVGLLRGTLFFVNPSGPASKVAGAVVVKKELHSDGHFLHRRRRDHHSRCGQDMHAAVQVPLAHMRAWTTDPHASWEVTKPAQQDIPEEVAVCPFFVAYTKPLE